MFVPLVLSIKRFLNFTLVFIWWKFLIAPCNSSGNERSMSTCLFSSSSVSRFSDCVTMSDLKIYACVENIAGSIPPSFVRLNLFNVSLFLAAIRQAARSTSNVASSEQLERICNEKLVKLHSFYASLIRRLEITFAHFTDVDGEGITTVALLMQPSLLAILLFIASSRPSNSGLEFSTSSPVVSFNLNDSEAGQRAASKGTNWS